MYMHMQAYSNELLAVGLLKIDVAELIYSTLAKN